MIRRELGIGSDEREGSFFYENVHLNGKLFGLFSSCRG